MKPDSSYRSEEALGKRSANRITVAYSGVHTAYQIALAAAEASLLDEFLCSLFVTPGKWGGWLARWVGDQTLVNRRCAGLPGDRVREHPWPFLSHRLKLKAFGAHHEPWTAANPKFDRWVAARLASSHSQVFVGYETCARDSFRVAQEKGMLRLLDVPQVHSAFLIQTLRSAHEELGLPFTGRIDNDEIAARKDEELRLADRILIYSEVHRRSFLEAGVEDERLIEIPLWADATLWDRPRDYRPAAARPLEVLFVGIVGVRKGVPWLLEAAKRLGRSIRLTLVGSVEEHFDMILRKYSGFFEYMAPLSKAALADEYRKADIFVLPSLVDSFGYVAMEAMLAGLPAIASTNCGVPLPDETWRVPLRDADAIAERLQMYIDSPALLEPHGRAAQVFARNFTPRRYRNKLAQIFRSFGSNEI